MHRFGINRLELPLLVPAVLIVIISLAVFYSIDTTIFTQQLIFLIASLFGYVLFLNIDYKILGYYSKYMYFAMIGVLLILFVIGIEARGAVRWIDLFGVRIQFSEIIKPFFVILMASFLTQNDKRTFDKFFKALLLVAPIFFLILKQPDLGNAMIYAIVTLFMLLHYGFPKRYFVSIGIFMAVIFPLIFNFLASYQKQRILTFINPTADPLASSYNMIQSLISVGSGGFFGKGFGQATQSILKFLPERHTDFIFATISESSGFMGAIILLGLYFFLLFKIYSLISYVKDDFSSAVLSGLYFMLLTHIFLNIGMNLGIVPIVGITLPFASYGGSSLLTNFIILGIISSIKFEFLRTNHLEIR